MSTDLEYRARKRRRKKKVRCRPARLNEKKGGRDLGREIKKQRRHFFVGRTTWRFYGGGKKMRNASGHQCKVNMSGSEEKKWARKRTTVFSMKRVIKKFLEVSRCSHARQRQRNVQKQCAARAKFFFAYYTYCCFSPFSCVASAA